MENPVIDASLSSVTELTLEQSQMSLPSNETDSPDHSNSQILVSSNENIASSPGNPLVKDCLSRSIGSLVAEESDEAPKPTEVLAKGISSVFGPVMKDFYTGIERALKSQSVLASSIGRLSQEFDKLLEDVPMPFAAQHATKLSGVRKRVLSLNLTLHMIQKRMDNIDWMLSGNATSLSTQISSASAEVYPVVNLHVSRRNLACQNNGQDEENIRGQEQESFDADIDEINM